MSALEPFSIADALPTGTTLLEASAGTGKTWTIGALVTRYVAEGVCTLEQMLVVTFGRAASQELRERVRSQLVEAERALGAAPEPTSARAPSELIELMLDCPPAERLLRHRRVVDALAGFDGATIATTHQFCSLVLGSLGIAGDTDSRARLVENLDSLLAEVVDDLYLRAFAFSEKAPDFTFAEALTIARKAAGDPQARLEPAEQERATPAGSRVAFGRAVRAEMARRKRRLGVLSYDDLLSQLATALEPEDAPARLRMRQRWRIVLVDEFQDTDPVQWQVLDRAFSGHSTMVLIGDPKQAIYAFRGGDVAAYLEAASTATTRKTLAVNWRSDRALLDGFQRVLVGAELGDPRIVVHDVSAHHDGSRLAGAPHGSPFRIRAVRRDQFGKRGSAPLLVSQTRPHIARDLALDIRALLESGATFDGRALERKDVAVISYRHADLAAAQDALHALGVPAVIAGGGSVFATPAADEWLELLEALEQPHRSARVRAAALTCFFGYSAVELDRPRADSAADLTDDIADTLRAWVEVFARRGVAAVLEAANIGGLAERVLGAVGGERRLTDLRHIGEALHEMVAIEGLGLVAVVAWLRAQITEARQGRGTERTRRLDSDAAAVQLVTIHASKGLEYPVVYLPALADRNVPTPSIPLFHGTDGRRSIAIGGPGGADWNDHVARWRDEEAGESLRLLYVALTRAQSQVVCWWAPTRNTPASALQRLVQGRRPGLGEVPQEFDNRSDDDAWTFFDRWEQAGGPAIEPAVLADPTSRVARQPAPQLAVRAFTREVDTRWRRTSYSSLTRVEVTVAQPGGVDSEPEVEPVTDEIDTTVSIPAPAAHSLRSPMADLPFGATFGSLVHAVLEHADPEAPDLRTELLSHIHEQLVRWPTDLDPGELADALVLVCDSPLGSLAPTTLRQVPLRDRMREMEFELPLSGGDRAAGGDSDARLRDLAPLLRRHLPDSDPLRGYADALDHPALGDQTLRGYLTGSVDLVIRVWTEHGPTYVVIDYKTNWLGGAPGELTAHDYRPQALAAAMGHSDYPLQALLYAAVLHRFLRWRQPDYDPARHLGGVAYLYLRGMCGPDTPLIEGEPCGVFSWVPPVTLVEALSDLLDGITGEAGS